MTGTPTGRAGGAGAGSEGGAAACGGAAADIPGSATAFAFFAAAFAGGFLRAEVLFPFFRFAFALADAEGTAFV